MTAINAIFRDGVFQPLEPVDLANNERVRLTVETAPKQTAGDWLQQVDRLRAALKARYGNFPDSAAEIATDRLR